MTVLARPNHPVRLAGVLAASVLAFGIVASAAGAVLYVVDNERGATQFAAPVQATVELPAGMVLIKRVDNTTGWKDALGFEPLLAEALPEGVLDQPMLYLQQPDARGRIAGHVRYAHADGSPAIALIEQQGTNFEEPPMKTEEPAAGTRLHLLTFTCGDLVVQSQVYFQAGDGELLAAAETQAIAEAFITDLREQCD